LWTANMEDGNAAGSASRNWTDLPKDKKLTGVQLVIPSMPKIYVCLKNYQKYYFVTEAMANPGDRKGKITAEIIGGHDISLGVGTEIRVEVTGAVRVSTYPLDKFKFSQDILRDGTSNGKARLETVKPVEAV